MQKAHLESALDDDGLRIYNQILERCTREEKGTVDNILGAVEAKFTPATTSRYSCLIFNHMCQEEGECLDSYVSRLLVAVKSCKFSNLENKLACNQFIFGLRDEKIREELMRNEDEELSLSKAIDIAKRYQAHTLQMKILNNNTWRLPLQQPLSSGRRRVSTK